MRGRRDYVPEGSGPRHGVFDKAHKKLYVVMLGGYNIILTCTFVHRTLAVLWK